jgi:spermidine/putrescine transport system permease protein
MSEFVGLFLAVLLAILIAPHIQKHADTVWTGVTRIQFVQKNGVFLSFYLVGAVLIWTMVMIILPQLYMVDFSFRHNLLPNEIGGPKDVYTLEHYRYLIFGRAGDEELFNYLHLKVFARTIIVSVLVTLFDFALCYPIAYYMAQVAKGGKARLLVLCLILPFWVNEILRAFAFRLLFGAGGVINQSLIGIGVLDQPIDFLGADVGLYAGLSYAYILLMIFPIYNAVESLDHNQIEAARDLGAPWWRIHYRVVMPHAKPGIASGCTMVFMLCAGALAAPQILGGPSSLWFTQIIYQWFNTGGNWPRGSAYAFVLLLICIVFVMLIMRFFKVRFGEIAKS